MSFENYGRSKITAVYFALKYFRRTSAFEELVVAGHCITLRERLYSSPSDMKGFVALLRMMRVIMVLAVLLGGTSAFTTNKQDRKHLAYKVGPTTREESAPRTSSELHQQPTQKDHHAPTTTAAFGVNYAAQAAVAVHGPYYFTQEDDDDDENLIGFGTALVSCFVSLALGFGLGYGT